LDDDRALMRTETRLQAMGLQDKYWLAGILEGEGSFMKAPPSSPNQPCLCVVMTDKDIIERVASLFDCGVVVVHTVRQNPKWKPTWKARLGGTRAVEMMLFLKPIMGIRRQSQIDRAISTWNPVMRN
jgi:hypothetical protein